MGISASKEHRKCCRILHEKEYLRQEQFRRRYFMVEGVSMSYKGVPDSYIHAAIRQQRHWRNIGQHGQEDHGESTELLQHCICRHRSDLRKKDVSGDTPLHTAVSLSVVSAVKLLLKAGADIHALNNRNLRPIEIHYDNLSSVIPLVILGHGECPILRMLASKEAESWPRAQRDDLRSSKFVVRAAKANNYYHLWLRHCLVRRDDKDDMGLSQGGDGWTALHWAAYHGNTDILQHILTMEVTPWAQLRAHLCRRTPRRLADAAARDIPNAGLEWRQTPAHIAVWKGHAGILDAISARAFRRDSLVDAMISTPDSRGRTPLVLAAELGRGKCVVALLRLKGPIVGSPEVEEAREVADRHGHGDVSRVINDMVRAAERQLERRLAQQRVNQSRRSRIRRAKTREQCQREREYENLREAAFRDIWVKEQVDQIPAGNNYGQMDTNISLDPPSWWKPDEDMLEKRMVELIIGVH